MGDVDVTVMSTEVVVTDVKCLRHTRVIKLSGKIYYFAILDAITPGAKNKIKVEIVIFIFTPQTRV